MQVVEGLAVSEGVSIGRAVVLETRELDVYRFPLVEADVELEVARFREAVGRAQEQNRATREEVGEELGEDLAAIFDAHGLLLADTLFLERIIERIRSAHVNAEWALYKATEELAERFANLEAPHLRERADDLRDVSRHLLQALQGISHHEISEIEGDVIIVADDLTPSDAVRLGRTGVVGFAVETGGRTSHTTIIARSLNLPAVMGAIGVTRLVTDDDPIIIDGTTGKVILHPTAEVLERYREYRREIRDREHDLVATRRFAAITRDEVPIQLMANIDLPEEIDEVLRFGAAGIGLYRSEFLYIEKYPRLPSEEEHLAIYRRLVEAAAPHPAIIRTYDLGGRKLARELMGTHEDNPVLGLRGIRLTLSRPLVFRTQLRALFRAAIHGELWIMVPMVTAVEEVRHFRAFAREVMAELDRESIPFGRGYKLGIMIEVPAAALIADLLAREVDFFSLGTNDLIQYSLAVDRNNEHVASLYQPLHPAMIRLLRSVVQAAQGAGIELSICGEMAGDERLTSLLLALGLRRLSVSPRRVPEIKNQVRRIAVRELDGLVDYCAGLATAAEVEAYLAQLGSEPAAQRDAAPTPDSASGAKRPC